MPHLMVLRKDWGELEVDFSVLRWLAMQLLELEAREQDGVGHL